jgi:flagellar M-ring protein FliF
MNKSDFLKNLNSNKIFGLLAVSAVVIGSMIFFIMVLTKTTLAPLYKNLNHEDTRVIALKLSEMGMDYEIDQDNQTILVSANQANHIRMILAQDGLPVSGHLFGQDFMQDDNLFGATQFQNDVNMTRMLEQKLASSINVISHIDSSRVHLVLSKNKPFDSAGIAASASIILKLKAGKRLNKKEINAISHLVAKSVPELSINNITIIDHRGSPLKLANQENQINDYGEFQNIEYQLLIENKIKLMLENLLESHVGQDKVKVSVTAKIKSDKEVIVSEVFDPDGQVVRSRKTSTEKEKDDYNKNNVSVANNIPNSNQVLGKNDEDFSKSKSNEITNYEISKKVTNRIIESGAIDRLSVAVMVDGIYKKDDKNNFTYFERSPKEISQIEKLVKSAVGYNDKRGDTIAIINLQFIESKNSNTIDDTTKKWLPESSKQILQLLIIGGVAVLVIFIIFRPMIQKIMAEKGLTFPGMESETAANNANNNNINTDGNAPPLSDFEQIQNQLNDIVSQDPDKSAAVIRNLLHNKS